MLQKDTAGDEKGKVQKDLVKGGLYMLSAKTKKKKTVFSCLFCCCFNRRHKHAEHYKCFQQVKEFLIFSLEYTFSAKVYISFRDICICTSKPTRTVLMVK